MRHENSELILSATDLAGFLACRHRTALDLGAATGAVEEPQYRQDPLLELLWQRGLDHEKRYVDSLRADGRSVTDLRDAGKADDRVAATLDAMRRGDDVIVQGALRDGPWFGYPDILQRIAAPSAFGDWSYEVADTKLARETKAGTILQLGLYSEMLGSAQGVRPERFHVVTPLGTETYRIDDYAAYFRLVRARMLSAVAQGHPGLAAAHYPEPVEHCEICRWWSPCADRRRAGVQRLGERLRRRRRRTLPGEGRPHGAGHRHGLRAEVRAGRNRVSELLLDLRVGVPVGRIADLVAEHLVGAALAIGHCTGRRARRRASLARGGGNRRGRLGREAGRALGGVGADAHVAWELPQGEAGQDGQHHHRRDRQGSGAGRERGPATTLWGGGRMTEQPLRQVCVRQRRGLVQGVTEPALYQQIVGA